MNGKESVVTQAGWLACLLLLFLILYSAAGSQAQTCGPLVAQKVAVIAVNIPGGTLPDAYSVSNLQDIFFGSNTPGVNVAQDIEQASGGQIAVSGDVYGPYDLTGNYTSCTDVEGAIRDDAFAAAIAAGVNLNNYNRYVLVFTSPSTWTSTCAGCADVGSCTTVTSSGTFNGGFVALNTSWMNPPNNNVTTRQVGVALGCHELGHSIGMLHSGALTPAILSDVVGPLGSPGSLNDGGNNNVCNSQGTVSYLGYYTADEQAAVGWLQQSNNGYALVQYPGTYTIAPMEGGGAGAKALKVQRGTNNDGYYLWIEYRLQNGSYDSTSQWTSAGPGVFVSYSDPTTDARQNHLLNFNFSLDGPYAGMGAPWSHPGLFVGQSWQDNYSDLSLTLVSQSGSGATVQIAYANGGGGTTTSANSGSAGTAIVTSVTPSSFSAGQTVPIVSTVTYGGTPIAGQTVTMTLTKPNGKKVSQSVISNASGQATWSYSLGRKPATGSYSVVSSTIYSKQTTISNTATFTTN